MWWGTADRCAYIMKDFSFLSSCYYFSLSRKIQSHRSGTFSHFTVETQTVATVLDLLVMNFAFLFTIVLLFFFTFWCKWSRVQDRISTINIHEVTEFPEPYTLTSLLAWDVHQFAPTTNNIRHPTLWFGHHSSWYYVTSICLSHISDEGVGPVPDLAAPWRLLEIAFHISEF